MSRTIPIVPMTVEGVEAQSIYISLIMYRSGATTKKLYYAFLDQNGAAIPNAEGNLSMSGGLDSSIEDEIEQALISQEGASTGILLRIVQVYDTNYIFQYEQGGDIFQTDVSANAIPQYVFQEITEFVFTELSITSYEPLVLYVKTVAESKGCTSGEVDDLMDYAQQHITDGSLDDWIQLLAFTGNSVDNKLWNILNHTDQLTKSGSPQSVADGVSILNDSGGEKLISEFEPGITGFEPGYGVVSTHPYMTVYAYFKTPTAAGIGNGSNIALITFDSGLSYPYLAGDNSSDYTFAITEDKEGAWMWRRNNLTQVTVRNAESALHTSTQPEAGFGSGKLGLQVRSYNGARGIFCFVGFGRAIDDSKAILFENNTESLMVGLNRNAA